ncbi:GNAT family N-acetyltransferase [Thermostilla marina]
MHWVYFKRYRMEIAVAQVRLPRPRLPRGYRFIPWHPDLIEQHAWVKHLSFRNEIDANVFACFLEYDRCLRLMREIASRSGFLPQATWLIAREEDVEIPRHGPAAIKYCATIQGILNDPELGGIQNVGVLPEERCRGLGRALLLQSLRGFQDAGARRVYLEVTAENEGAIRLYRRLGFKTTKTVYRVVEARCPQ